MSFILFFITACIVIDATNCIKYEANWKSLDTRPIPGWYDDAKIGVFINWGVYSVPGVHDEWIWWWWKGPTPLSDVTSYMKKFYPPNFTYADFAPKFRAEFYDPNKWRDIIVASGAKYVYSSISVTIMVINPSQ
jgi:alpha-L-fucosidase